MNMTANFEVENQVVLLETKDAPESDWVEYLASNPYLIFHGMKILEITKIEVSDVGYSKPISKVRIVFS